MMGLLIAGGCLIQAPAGGAQFFAPMFIGLGVALCGERQLQRTRRRLRLARETVYLLTDRRVVVCGWGDCRERSFGTDSLVAVEMALEGEGRGSLYFSTPGACAADWEDDRAQHHIAFHGVPDVREVHELAREVARLPTSLSVPKPPSALSSR